MNVIKFVQKKNNIVRCCLENATFIFDCGYIEAMLISSLLLIWFWYNFLFLFVFGNVFSVICKCVESWEGAAYK